VQKWQRGKEDSTKIEPRIYALVVCEGRWMHNKAWRNIVVAAIFTVFVVPYAGIDHGEIWLGRLLGKQTSIQVQGDE